ncbi:hypothetical protein [Streptomyces sp. NPDC021020]|uniref:hypothetical protein n=1 Tax=Streptomyces sp. NPDC021020 TaxID=3365109 RepID=UPI00378D336E
MPRDTSSRTRELLLGALNAAVRRPGEHGGLGVVARLLGELAAREPWGGEAVWLADTNARLTPSMLLREGFSGADVHVVASQYGEDAYRRGWLRLDRTLTAGEHAGLVAGVLGWAGSDRTLLDVVGEFGAPSVVFGPADPGLPKTLGYAARERTEPFVTFHLGAAAEEAALLAVRVDDGFLDGWALTPWGESRFG